jgi:predicted nucleic acid-binding protein
LINGNLLQIVVDLPTFFFFVGDNVIDQEILDQVQRLKVVTIIGENKIKLLDSNVTFSQFTHLKKKYNLGDGETECMALCKNYGYVIASDDQKARTSSIVELGEGRVIGSLYLIRQCVRELLIDCESAVQSKLMEGYCSSK